MDTNDNDNINPNIPAESEQTNGEQNHDPKPEDVEKILAASVNPDSIKAPEDAVPAEVLKPIPKRKTLSIIIHDVGVLRAAYMQFVKGGGLFIPTKKPFNMGEDTNLVIRLLDEEDPYRVAGKVVWITPVNTSSNKAGGIGVEFAEDKNGERLRSRIEVILGPHLKSQESTHTM